MNTSNLTRWLGIGLVVLGVVWIWRNVIAKKSNLQKHYEVEADLQTVSRGVNATSEAALNDYPLTTIGDTPFAGVWLDVFMPDSPGAQSRPIEWLQSILNSHRPDPGLGADLKDPNTKN